MSAAEPQWLTYAKILGIVVSLFVGSVTAIGIVVKGSEWMIDFGFVSEQEGKSIMSAVTEIAKTQGVQAETMRLMRDELARKQDRRR